MIRWKKAAALAAMGGVTYGLIELAWRGHTHWTMVVLGGALFLLLGGINEVLRWDTPLPLQAVLCAAAVTVAEFVTGCVVNLWLGWEVWDYSHMPLNVLGQICLPYALIWVPLSALAIVLDDYLRFWLFGEERPRYQLL